MSKRKYFRREEVRRMAQKLKTFTHVQLREKMEDMTPAEISSYIQSLRTCGEVKTISGVKGSPYMIYEYIDPLKSPPSSEKPTLEKKITSFTEWVRLAIEALDNAKAELSKLL